MASEQFSKYYGDDLRPIYEVPSADGKKMVKVTLAQARKLNLIPSVSRIKEEKANFAITEWRIEQAVRACIAYPYNRPTQSEEDIKAYLALIKAKADEYRKETADRGKEIHKAIERFLRDEEVDRSDPAIDTAINQILEKFCEWGVTKIRSEMTVGGRKYGFCGTPDVVLDCEDGVMRIVDIKTTDLAKFEDFHDEWKLQLGAYHLATEGTNTELWQAVVDRNSGETRFFRHADEERWKAAFKALLDFYCLVNNHDTRIAPNTQHQP